MSPKKIDLGWERAADGRSPRTRLGGKTPPRYWKLSLAALAGMFEVNRLTAVFAGVPLLFEAVVRLGRRSKDEAVFVGAYECPPADQESAPQKLICVRRGRWTRRSSQGGAAEGDLMSGCSVETLFVTADAAKAAEGLISNMISLLRRGLPLAAPAHQSTWERTQIEIQDGATGLRMSYPATLQPGPECRAHLEQWFTWAFGVPAQGTVVPDPDSQFTMSYRRSFGEQLANR